MTAKFYTIMAAVPEQQLKDLQILITTACAVTFSGKTSKELKDIANEIGTSAHKGALALSSDCVTYLMKIIGGSEVDQDELTVSMKELRQGLRQEIKTDARSVDYNTRDILNCTTAYLINNGEPALNKVRALAPSLGDKRILQNLVSEGGSQKDFRKPLEKIVQKVTGQKGVAILTTEQIALLKSKSEDIWAEYMRLRKGFNTVWKEELRNLVFSSGKPAIDYQKLLAHFTANGIESTLASGFQGFIDGNGALYTAKGKAINGVPGFGFSVKMNPDYDPVADNQYVFTTYNAEGKISQYVYTKAYRKIKNAEKFVKVENLVGAIEKMRKKWLQLVKLQDLSLACVAATAMEVMYTFSARIGSPGNMADGKPSFGISTLEGKHVKIAGSKAIIAYRGKGGVIYKHVLDANASAGAKMLVANMARIGEGKDANDKFWTYEANGSQKVLQPGHINGLFKKLGAPAGVTIHKIRHVKGTALFDQMVEALGEGIYEKGITQDKANAIVKDIATKVGAALGHVKGVGAQQKATGSTALQNYIDPSSVARFYERLNLQLPRALQPTDD